MNVGAGYHSKIQGRPEVAGDRNHHARPDDDALVRWMVSGSDERIRELEGRGLMPTEREQRATGRNAKEGSLHAVYGSVHELLDSARKSIDLLHSVWTRRLNSGRVVTARQNRSHWQSFCIQTTAAGADMATRARDEGRRMVDGPLFAREVDEVREVAEPFVATTSR